MPALSSCCSLADESGRAGSYPGENGYAVLQPYTLSAYGGSVRRESICR